MQHVGPDRMPGLAGVCAADIMICNNHVFVSARDQREACMPANSVVSSVECRQGPEMAWSTSHDAITEGATLQLNLIACNTEPLAANIKRRYCLESLDRFRSTIISTV